MRVPPTNDMNPAKQSLVLPVILALVLSTIAGRTAIGQIVDPSRTVVWRGNVGVEGGILHRTSVLDCVNDLYAGKIGFNRDGVTDDGPAIAACVGALSPGDVAFLEAGTYALHSDLRIGKSDVTLRGAGPDQTTLAFHGDAAGTSNVKGYINVEGTGEFEPSLNLRDWTAGHGKGGTVVTLSDTSGLTVDTVLALDQSDDNTDLVFGTGTSGKQFTRDNQDRHLTQFVSVKAINGNQVTIDPPLYWNYDPALAPEAYWFASVVRNTGIEDLMIDPSPDATDPADNPDYNVQIQYAENVWLKNVDSFTSDRAHVRTFRTARIELRDSYFHSSRAYRSEAYGIELWHSSGVLVENNRFDELVTPMLLASGASGNVFGYNFANSMRYDQSMAWLTPSLSGHASHAFMNLFEGNVAHNFYMDDTWGSSSHNTAFRNRLTGHQPGRNINTHVVVLEAHARHTNVLGNILGTDGYHTLYDIHSTPSNVESAIYALGYESPDTKTLVNYDSSVLNTLMRHLNWDWVTDAVHRCDAEAAGPGCQGGDPSAPLPDSLYLPAKPAWFGSCRFPPFDPEGPEINPLPAELTFSGTPCPLAPPGGGPPETETTAFVSPQYGGVALQIPGESGSGPVVTHGELLATQGDPPSVLGVVQLRDADGFIASESSVEGSPPVDRGVVFVETGGQMFAPTSSAPIDDPADAVGLTHTAVDTGIAFSNPGILDAPIWFHFTDADGAAFGHGSFTLPAGNQVARFLTEPPFNAPNPMVGSFTFRSGAPVGVIALRGLRNQDGEFLFATLPAPNASAPGEVLPMFATGGGWTTQVVLTNAADSPRTGTMTFLGRGSWTLPASPANVKVNGTTGSTFDYRVPPQSTLRFVVESAPSAPTLAGSVRVTPLSSDGSIDPPEAPAVMAILAYGSGGVLESEATIDARPPGIAFRVYVERSGTSGEIGSVRSGLSLVNLGAAANEVNLAVTGLDGTPIGGGGFTIPGAGHVSLFVDEVVAGLPDPFEGIVRLTAETPVIVAALRTRISRNGRFLLTSTPPSNEALTMPTPVLPHLVSGGGYSTRILIYGASGEGMSGTLTLRTQEGQTLPGF